MTVVAIPLDGDLLRVCSLVAARAHEVVAAAGTGHRGKFVALVHAGAEASAGAWPVGPRGRAAEVSGALWAVGSVFAETERTTATDFRAGLLIVGGATVVVGTVVVLAVG